MSVGQKQFHGTVPVSVAYEFRPGYQPELEPPKHVAGDGEASRYRQKARVPFAP